MATLIHIHNSLPGLIEEYYMASPQENIGNAFLKIDPVFRRFSSFEGLLNNISTSKAHFHVVVCHGSSSGLYMSLGSQKNVTIDDNFLGEICKIRDDIKDKKPPHVANNFSLGDKFIINLAKTAAKIQEKSSRLFVRGCNIGANPKNVRLLANVFGAFGISAPKFDQLYVRISPGIVKEAKLLKDIGIISNSKTKKWSSIDGNQANFFKIPVSKYSTGEEQRKMSAFQGKLHDLGKFVFNVEHDGGSKASSKAWTTKGSKMHIFGHLYNRLWLSAPVGPASQRFIAKIIWDDVDNMMWFPLMDGYPETHLTFHP
jgi:hypothetical protein